MKSNLYQKLAILLVGLTVSVSAYADVKIKSRQTVSGRSTENTTLIKGKRQRTESMNGATISIMQCDLRRDVTLNPAAQTYLVSMYETAATAAKVPNQTAQTKTAAQKGGLVTTIVTNKDTGERKQMFGYPARHILTTMETSSSPDSCTVTKSKMQIDAWYIDAEFTLDCLQNRSYANYGQQNGGGCQDKSVVKTVGAAIKTGYPVFQKMTMFDESGKETLSMINEVVELSKATLDAALFDVPADYREVKDSSELYAMNFSNAGNSSVKMSNGQNYDSNDSNQNSAMNQNVKNLAQAKSNEPTVIGAKKEGTIRVGLAGVKTGAVGDGMNASELAGAIQNTFGAYLKGSKVELVPLEAKLASALDAEAKEKQCDFVLYAQVSHKKGGGGFGMFKSIAPVLGSVAPMAGMSGNVAGAVAGSVASTAIYTAAGASANVKAKDEITLDVNLKQPLSGASVLTKQYKAKAKSGGEDIISPIIEQAAQAIIDAAAK